MQSIITIQHPKRFKGVVFQIGDRVEYKCPQTSMVYLCTLKSVGVQTIGKNDELMYFAKGISKYNIENPLYRIKYHFEGWVFPDEIKTA